MDAYEVNLARSAWDKVLSARYLLDNDIELVRDGDIYEAVDHLTNALAELENLMGDYKPAGGRESEPPTEEPTAGPRNCSTCGWDPSIDYGPDGPCEGCTPSNRLGWTDREEPPTELLPKEETLDKPKVTPSEEEGS